MEELDTEVESGAVQGLHMLGFPADYNNACQNKQRSRLLEKGEGLLAAPVTAQFQEVTQVTIRRDGPLMGS